MFKRLSIILIPLIFIFGCRNTKTVTSETHFFDTTKVILIDTLNYKDDGVKIVLTPKNDVIFESSDELFETITSQNYSVKEIEVNRSVLEGFNRMEEQTEHPEDVNVALDSARDFINDNNFFAALDILNGIKNRNDVWYYYSAVSNLALGNNITAMAHARMAKSINPGRPEYDELINGMESGSLQYRGRSDSFVPQKTNKGNICLKLIIANVALNVICGGGGLCLSGPCAVC